MNGSGGLERYKTSYGVLVGLSAEVKGAQLEAVIQYVKTGGGAAGGRADGDGMGGWADGDAAGGCIEDGGGAGGGDGPCGDVFITVSMRTEAKRGYNNQEEKD